MPEDKIKKESFEWVIRPENIPIKNLAKIVAKTPASTDHRNDMTLPESERVIREFSIEEIRDAAKSLAERPMGWNHRRLIDGAAVLDSQWNEKELQLECLAYLPTLYIEKIRRGEISTVSVEFSNREEIRNGETVEYKGLIFNRLDLVEGKTAGDPNTQITLFETKDGAIEGQISLVEMVVQRGNQWCVIHCHGPDAGKAIKCFDNKADADQMHAAIQANKEGFEIKEFDVEELKTLTFAEIKKESVIPDPNTQPPKKKPEEIIAEKDIRITELETAVSTATKATQDLKANHDQKVATAKQEGKNEVIEKIKAKIPPTFVENKFGMGAKRFVEEIKKVVHEESKGE